MRVCSQSHPVKQPFIAKHPQIPQVLLCDGDIGMLNGLLHQPDVLFLQAHLAGSGVAPAVQKIPVGESQCVKHLPVQVQHFILSQRPGPAISAKYKKLRIDFFQVGNAALENDRDSMGTLFIGLGVEDRHRDEEFLLLIPEGEN